MSTIVGPAAAMVAPDLSKGRIKPRADFKINTKLNDYKKKLIKAVSPIKISSKFDSDFSSNTQLEQLSTLQSLQAQDVSGGESAGEIADYFRTHQQPTGLNIMLVQTEKVPNPVPKIINKNSIRFAKNKNI